MIQYLSAWCISHATSSKMYFRSAFHKICCICFGHLVSHTCKSNISMQIKNIVKIFSLYIFGIIIGRIFWKQSSFPTILNQVVGSSQQSTPVSPGKEYSVLGIRNAVLKSYSTFIVWKRNCGTSGHRIFCVRKWNFKSQKYSACGISLVPYAMARMARVRRGHRPLGQSRLGGAVIYCSILAVAPTGIFVRCLRYYQAVTNQLTYAKDPDIRHTSLPKAAGIKLPTGSTRQSEGEFSTL